MDTMMVTEATASVITAGDSPWFSGHFPNTPILPGIAQLKMVVDLIRQSTADDVQITGLSRVKFRKIVLPDEQLDIRLIFGNKENYCMFMITSGSKDVCSGKMHFTHNIPSITS